MKIVVIGCLFGDEGKAKVEAGILEYNLFLPKGEEYTVCARYSGGCNSGQTRMFEEQERRSHIVPVGVDYPHVYSVFLSGGVLYPEKAVAEIEELRKIGCPVDITRFGISGGVQVSLKYHLEREAEQESGEGRFGTTMNAIGPTYVDAAAKMGIRMAEFCNPRSFGRFLRERTDQGVIEEGDVRRYMDRYRRARRFLSKFVIDQAKFMEQAKDQNWVLGGAQSVGLDVFDGTMPYTTSSSSIRLPVRVDRKIGVYKLVPSRVGSGPFVTEMERDMQDALRGRKGEVDAEYGKSTGRPRRLGWPDDFFNWYAASISDTDGVAFTKLDKVRDVSRRNRGRLLVCKGYKYRGQPLESFPDNRYVLERCKPIYEEVDGWDEDLSPIREFSDLPHNAQEFIKRRCEALCREWEIISVGPRTEQIIVRN